MRSHSDLRTGHTDTVADAGLDLNEMFVREPGDTAWIK